MKRFSITYAVLAIVAILLLYVLAKMSVDIKSKDTTIEHLRVELAKAQEYVPAEVYTVRDSVTVAKKEVVEVKKSDYKNKVADKGLIDDIGGDIDNIDSQTKVSTEIGDTVKVSIVEDSIYQYKDYWTTIRLDKRDTTLTYSITDSAVVYVSRIPKHRFLWWKWGVKGYDIKVACMNPHATIRHISCVTIR